VVGLSIHDLVHRDVFIEGAVVFSTFYNFSVTFLITFLSSISTGMSGIHVTSSCCMCNNASLDDKELPLQQFLN